MKFILLSLLLLSTPSWAAQYEKQHIKAVKLVAPDWPGLTNPDGSGLYWEIIRKVYEPVDIAVRYSDVPWNRALKMVTEYYLYSGIVGVVEGDGANLILPHEPLDRVYLHSLATPAQPPFTHQANVRVAWQKGYDLFPPGTTPFETREYRTPEQAIEMLNNGEVDYLLDTREALLDYILLSNQDPKDFQLNRLPGGKGVYIGFYDVPSSRLLIDIYDQRIQQLKASGELQALYDKYSIEMP